MPVPFSCTEELPGFPSWHLAHRSGQSTCDIYEQGATVYSWKITQQELLFVSPKNQYAPGKALRGGIPVVFPQFGPGKLPQHGFVRAAKWRYEPNSAATNESTGDVSAVFVVHDDESTRASTWPYRFELRLAVTLRLTSLHMHLSVLNTDQRTFEFTALLHTYFRTASIARTKVHGLKGLMFIDKVNNAAQRVDENEVVEFPGEIDRIYIGGGEKKVSITDEGNADIIFAASNFRDLVVWNPGAEKAKSMADLDEENYSQFVCVEAGSVHEPVVLERGKTWAASQVLSLNLNS